MNIGLLNILHNKVWDFRPDMAQGYADALKNAIELHVPNDVEKEQGFFLSKKGYQKDGVTHAADFEEKLYVDNINRIEDHLYWNDEELAEDDQIIDVVYIDGPVTRDGDICSYGTKDFRDQVMYANTIPQVVGHIFFINTPGGQASCRNDYETMIADCREKGKPTVAFVDGMCCSSGVNLACRCDRVIVMSGKDEFGCIGTMAAFWAIAHDTVDRDGYRYVELVGSDCPEKNDWYREAAKGEYEKLQAELDRDTEEFHNEVRQNRPLVTDDMLTGRVFGAQEVIPALVDEIGDMNRAIECVFELADQTLVAARLVTAEPKEDEGEKPEHEEPEESTHKNDKDMTEEEKKAQEAEAAAAAAQEQKPADEEVQKPAEEVEQKPAEEAEKPAEEAEKPADEEQKPSEEEEKPADEEEQKPAEEEEKPADEEEKPADEEEKPADEEEKPAEQPSEEAIENATAELDKIQETLHNAEQMIADKDKEIAELKESLATLNGIAEERDAAVKERNDISASLEKAGLDYAEQGKALSEAETKIAEHVATIEKLTKQVADLKAEVKELAGKPAPMTDGAAGVPAGNGTGEAPKDMGSVKSEITSDMTVDEIRERLRQKDEKQKTYRH